MAGSALAHLLVAVLLCTQFARGASETQSASSPEGGGLLGITEKKLLEDQLDIPKKKPATSHDLSALEDSYNAINGFLVEGDKSVVRKGKPQCEQLCNSNPECRSYSFRQRDNTCVVSIKSLRYNPSWEFFARGLKPDHTGKLIDSSHFHGFPGMFADGFETKHDIDKEDCRETCEANPRCRSFSVRKRTKSCILSNSGVQYDPEFVYYENEQRVAENPFEDASDKEKRANVEKSEAVMAKQDRKARLRKEAQQEAAELTQKLLEHKKEQVAAEAAEKTKAKQEQKEYEEQREANLDESIKAAKVRGEYAETVHKSHLSIKETKSKISKENRAKATVSLQNSQKSSESNQKKNLAAASENHMKKLTSRTSLLSKKTADKTEYLTLRARAFQIQAQAKQLAAEQRSFMGSGDPRDEERLQEENKLLAEKSQVEAKLKTAASKATELAKEIAEKKKTGNEELKLVRRAGKQELALAQKESEVKISEAKTGAEKQKAKLKLQKLEAPPTKGK